MKAGVVAYFLIVNVPAVRWHAPLSEGRSLMGRLAEADIRIPDEYECVSLRHAQIVVNQRGIWMRDLGSSSGTSINSVPLSPLHEVHIQFGDRIRLGTLEIEVVREFAVKAGIQRRGQADGFVIAANAACRQRLGTTELSRLTNTEHELVMWMARGYTQPEELGNIFFRSPHTVRTHMKSVFQKLGVHSRVEMLSCLRRFASPELSAISATAETLNPSL